MTFTFDNRFDLRPTHFSSVPLMPVDVAMDTCNLFLRAYDIEQLVDLLMDRRINVRERQLNESAGRASGAIIQYPVTSYFRNQGRARARASSWWRDKHAFVSRGLLALCALTQDLDPFARVPNPEHPSHPQCPPARAPRTTEEENLAWPWARTLRKRPLPPQPLLIPPEPFRERDGSRFEPFEHVRAYSAADARTGARTGLIAAWLPRCVIERLAECGANFREEGKFGKTDPTGKFAVLNRAAGVRRLIQALETAREESARGEPSSLGVNLDAPFAFRGVELTKNPPSPKEWAANQAHWHTMRRQIREADARRVLSAKHAPRGYLALMDMAEEVKAGCPHFSSLSATGQREAVARWAQMSVPNQAIDAGPQEGLAFVDPVTTAGRIVVLAGTTGVRNKIRAPRKVRAATIDKPFNADELG